MSWFLRTVSSVFSTAFDFDTVSSAFDFNKATLSGALDVVAVQHEDGTLKSTPFHVRFGKLKVFRYKNKKVKLFVNGKDVGITMKVQLGEAGEAYFIVEIPKHRSRSSEETMSISGESYTHQNDRSHTPNNVHSTQSSPIARGRDLDSASNEQHTAPFNHVGSQSYDPESSVTADPSNKFSSGNCEALPPPLLETETNQQSSPTRTWHWGWGHLPRRKGATRKNPQHRKKLMIPLQQNLYVSKATDRKVSRRHSTGHAIDPVDIGVSDIAASQGHSNYSSERLFGNLYELNTPYMANNHTLKLESSSNIRMKRSRSSSLDLSDQNAGVVSSPWRPLSVSTASLVGIPFAAPSLRTIAGEIRIKKDGTYPWGFLGQTEIADRAVPQVCSSMRIPWLIQRWTQSPWRTKLCKDKGELVSPIKDKDAEGVEFEFSCTTCNAKNRILLDTRELAALRMKAEELAKDYAPSESYIGIGSPLSSLRAPWFASIHALTTWYPSLNSTTTCYDAIEVSKCGDDISQFEAKKCFAVDTFPHLNEFLLSIRQPSSICLRFSVRLRYRHSELPVTLYTSYFAGTQLILFNILRSQATERISASDLSADHDVYRNVVATGNTVGEENAPSSSSTYEPKYSRSQRFFRWLGMWMPSTPQASGITEGSKPEKKGQQEDCSNTSGVSSSTRSPIFSFCRQCLGVQRISLPTGKKRSNTTTSSPLHGEDGLGTSNSGDFPLQSDEEWSKKKGWKSILGGGYSRRRAKRLSHQQAHLLTLDDAFEDMPEQIPEQRKSADVGFSGRDRSSSTAVSFANGPSVELRSSTGARRKSLPSVLPLTWSAKDEDTMPGAAATSSHPIAATTKPVASASSTTGGTSRSRARSIFSYIWGGKSNSDQREQESSWLSSDSANASHLPSKDGNDIERASTGVDVVSSPKSQGYGQKPGEPSGADNYEKGVEAALEDTAALQQTFREQVHRDRGEPEDASNASVSEETVHDDSDSENIDTSDPDTKRVRRIYPTSEMLERMELLKGPNLLTFVVCQSSEESEETEREEQGKQANGASGPDETSSTVARTRSFSDMGPPSREVKETEETAPMSTERRHSFSESRPSTDDVRGDFLAEVNEAQDSSRDDVENGECFGKDLAGYNAFAAVSCTLYLWDADAKVVVSDVDGTITRSDLWGHIMYYLPIQDWTHPGVAELFANISKNGYHMMYLTSRAIGQIEDTKSYLFNVTQRRSSVAPPHPSQEGVKQPKKEMKSESTIRAYADDPLGIGGLARTDSVKGAIEKNSSDKKVVNKEIPVAPDSERQKAVEPALENSTATPRVSDTKNETVAQNTESKKTLYERLKEEFHSQRESYLERAGTFRGNQEQTAFDSAGNKSVTLPPGPVITSPDRLFDAVKREVILRKPQEFKISALTDIKRLFGTSKLPFYAGFGNRDTDVIAYKKVGIREGKIFIINPKGEIHAAGDSRRFKASYWALNSLVDTVFPKISPSTTVERVDTSASSASVNSTSVEEASENTHPLGSRHGRPIPLDEEYNDLNYWRLNPIPIIESDEEESQDSSSTSEDYQSAGDDEDNFDSHRSPYRSGGKVLPSHTENSWRHSEINPLRLQSTSPADRSTKVGNSTKESLKLNVNSGREEGVE